MSSYPWWIFQQVKKWLLVLFMTLLSFVIDPYLSHATPEGLYLMLVLCSSYFFSNLFMYSLPIENASLYLNTDVNLVI
jgi:hypothetical protein